MKIVTAAEMREIDRLTTEKYGVPSLTLMENAGGAVARFVLEHYPRAQRVVAVCGKGNNGGDGLVAARKLHEAGRSVAVVLLARAEEVKGDAKQMLGKLPLTPLIVTSSQELKKCEEVIGNADVILDAIFGTGFHPPLPGLAASISELIDQSSASVISVDIPSGADADSFDVTQLHACRSNGIVTFTAPKPGVLFSTLTRGRISVAPIGSPDEAVISELNLEWNAAPAILRRERQLNSNKGLYGHALVIGGSLGKSGAPTMASMAALRIGAGLVTAAVPKSVLPVVAGSIPELMTEPLDENDGGSISEHALNEPECKKLLARKNVVALGPGIGRDPDTVQSIRSFVARCSLPLVLDADGLNAFEGAAHLLDGHKHPLVLTPHPGEMARLIGKSVAEVESHRLEVAREVARKHHAIIVLKGWRTLIAVPDGQVWVNTTGNPGLAKGGSGDVLTGMIAGMMAQFPGRTIEAADAVRAAVYLHGLAADLAVAHADERTLLATDVIHHLNDALRSARTTTQGLTTIQRDLQPISTSGECR